MAANVDFEAHSKAAKINCPSRLQSEQSESTAFSAQQHSEVIQEPLPLKPEILVKKSVVLVKRRNGFTKTVPWTENPGKIRTEAF